jgi:maleate isomerase
VNGDRESEGIEAAGRHAPQYGSRALFGIAVPQGNPTVEPEMWSMAPPGVSLVTTRLLGSRTNSDNRLRGYIDNLETSIAAYDTAPVDALGIACTGSSYLLGRAEETRRIGALATKYGYPIITAGQAIIQAFASLDASRIALLAPYPEWLVDASRSYWKDWGVELKSVVSYGADSDDTRDVYRFTAGNVAAAAAKLDHSGADAILLTGTGVPTLTALADIAAQSGKPVLSSNLCLMWALLQLNARTRDPRPTALVDLVTNRRDLA